MESTSTQTRATAGLVSRCEIAADLGVAPRTIIRFEKLGLPALHVGKQRLYDPARVRAWLMTREKHHEPPRGPGRPRRAA